MRITCAVRRQAQEDVASLSSELVIPTGSPASGYAATFQAGISV